VLSTPTFSVPRRSRGISTPLMLCLLSRLTFNDRWHLRLSVEL
jgi:hypothetical protein